MAEEVIPALAVKELTVNGVTIDTNGGGGGAPEGTAVLSTGEAGATKFLREDGDGSCSWQEVGGAFTSAAGTVNFTAAGDIGIFESTATTGATLTIDRDLGSASTDDAVFKIINDNSGDDQVGLKIQQDGTGAGLFVDCTNTGAAEGFRISRNSPEELTQFCRARSSSVGSNIFQRDLSSADTAGPVIKIIQTNTGDDQACMAFQQDAAAKVLDFDECADGGTGKTTIAGSILVEMPNGSTGYINFYN